MRARRGLRTLWAALTVGALAACSPGAGGGVPVATEVPVAGDLAVHDPSLVVGEQDGDPWYLFSTGYLEVNGGAPQIRRSTDGGKTWELLGTVWDRGEAPAWVYGVVPAVTNFWAPEVVEHDGTWYLYYAASTFGSQTSVIGLVTSPALDPDDPDYGWTDQGEVWRSGDGDDYNAIDPAVLVDGDGSGWLAFGSFWGGIQLLPLEWPSGKPPVGAEPTTIARRSGPPDAIEGASLVHRGDWYYLFVSRDTCCQGLQSTYNVAVARSSSAAGPYAGVDGTPAPDDGATPLLTSVAAGVGPGGQSVSGGYLAFHYYATALDGASQLGIRKLGWTADGWPVATLEPPGDATASP